MSGRRQLMQRLVAGLPRGSDAVAYPDHPLLFRAPELLVAHEGSLVCIFLYSARDSYTTAAERSRMLLTRLAMPRGTALVLAVENSDRLGALEHSVPFHDEVIVFRPNSALRTPAGRIALGRGAEVVEELKPFHNERFADAWTATVEPVSRRERPLRNRITTAEVRRQSREIGAGTEAPTPIPARMDGRQLDVPENAVVGGTGPQGIGGHPESLSRSEVTRILNRDAMNAVELDYYIDRGVNHLPDVAGMLSQGGAALEIRQSYLSLPRAQRTHDAVKPLRAAAFAGIESLLNGEQ